ncbi:hypothetical protein ACLOJK_031430 [Asimina triloba]
MSSETRDDNILLHKIRIRPKDPESWDAVLLRCFSCLSRRDSLPRSNRGRYSSIVKSQPSNLYSFTQGRRLSPLAGETYDRKIAATISRRNSLTRKRFGMALV